MKYGIIDLEINNLNSVVRAFASSLEPSDSLSVISDAKKTTQPDVVILPGLGNFSAGMKALSLNGLSHELPLWVGTGTKVIGICLGMQLLASSSEESPGVKGLDLIPSTVKRLPSDTVNKVPHIGWAETTSTSGHFSALNNTGDFYFVHSYHLEVDSDEHILSRTHFGQTQFTSSVIAKNILGFQFHPEKSGFMGRKLVKEIIGWTKK
jgi:glutamine amidotransferase